MKLTSVTRPARRNAGFSLLEMVIVLGIIAMLMGFAIYSMTGISDQAKPIKAKGDISGFLSALTVYKAVNGTYPSTNQGLKALVGKGLTKITKDPWDRDYVYRYPGKKNPNEPEIFSLGSDAQEGTADDINSQNF